MRNKLKNLTAITLALALGLAVVGCGGSAAEAPASAAPQAPAAPAMHHSPATRAPAQAQLAPAAACALRLAAPAMLCSTGPARYAGCTLPLLRAHSRQAAPNPMRQYQVATVEIQKMRNASRCTCRTCCASTSTAIAAVGGAEFGRAGGAVAVGCGATWRTARRYDFRGL